jgi:hypothetical protein
MLCRAHNRKSAKIPRTLGPGVLALKSLPRAHNVQDDRGASGAYPYTLAESAIFGNAILLQLGKHRES